MTLRRAAAAAAIGACALVSAGPGCGTNDKNQFVKPFDAGAEAEAGEDDAGPEVDPTLGGPCLEDKQCDDKIPCTFDRCDTSISRCRNVPDDTQCDDGIYCNGKEKCVLRTGCAGGAVVTCQDDDLCTIDKCVEGTKSCTHGARDVDGDGDPDGHCVAGHDCDDNDPTVSSQKVEICANGKDDNCDGSVDEQPCSQPANDVCATALAVTASGTYFLTTVAAKKDYATTCSVKNAAASKDIVVAITAPGALGDPPKDVEVWATSEVDANEIAVAMQTTCGDAASELECEHLDGVANARAIARGVTPGATVYAIVTAQNEAAIDVKVDIRNATAKPANEACGAPLDVPTDAPFLVQVIDPAKDLASGCDDKARTGDLTYRFTLGATQDVRIFASTVTGSGTPVVSLRDATCTGELRCRVGSSPAVFARSLAAGTYVFTVSGTSQLDASVLVKTLPPTTAPPNQTCATAPAAPINTTFFVDLSNQEDAIANGCFPGGPAAAYDLELAVPSDVLVVGRFPLTEQGAVSLNLPACGTGDVLACSQGNTPQRVSKRNLPAGSYRVVVADLEGQNVELDVLVRPAVAPTALASGSDGCIGTVAIPAAGGFFTGDTTGATADYNAGCDAPGEPIGGARDQLLRLDLATKQRVVLDMSGSVYTTLLDVRQGSACPGIEVPNGCYVGFGPNRSFLDMPLGPGTFWVQVDGYAGDRGAWNLDVRLLPP